MIPKGAVVFDTFKYIMQMVLAWPCLALKGSTFEELIWQYYIKYSKRIPIG